ncbi:MAG: HD domain-containing protein [Candidatus Omnitrophica bacterium]|nr:HD domain-containing protein [Candidatus Omnitrophota bacterium]
MDIIEKVERCMRGIFVCVDMAKLYSTQHPIFKNSIDTLYGYLQDAFKDRAELVIGIIGEELAFDTEIFFDLSKIVGPSIIHYFKEKEIEKVTFYSSLRKEEIEKFIVFLLTPKEELKTDTEGQLMILGIENIVVAKISVSESGPNRQRSKLEESLLQDSYEDYLNQTRDIFETIIESGKIDILALKISFSSLIEQLTDRHQEVLKMVAIKKHDVTTFVHMVNVAILAMYFASRLGFGKKDTIDIGISALLHDIGKIYIARKIVAKTEKLREEEFSKIRSHTLLGAEILLRYVDNLGILPVLVAFEHHLKFDLTGYPKLNFRYKPHIASLIVSICDVYDALCQRRSYKSYYPAEAIYSLMMREKGRLFEPNLLDRFFKIIGVWPIGTILLLNDGRVAVVRKQNEDDIFCPIIEVIHPQEKKEVIDLKGNSNIKIERSLDPFKECKDYLSLI